jgi:hypothetical protein
MTRYVHIDKITEVFDPIIRKIEVHNLNTKHRKRLENRLIDGRHRKPTATESILKQEKK